MDGPRDYHVKWNKSERKRQISYITYVWNLKQDTNELTYETNRLRDVENRLVTAKRGWVGGGMDWVPEVGGWREGKLKEGGQNL